MLWGLYAMKTEKKYQFRERMCEVHRPGLRNDAALVGKDGLLLDGRFAICLYEGAEIVARRAAADLADCLRVSYGVTVAVIEGSAPFAVRFRLASDAPDTAPSGSEVRAYRIVITADGVTITANTERGFFPAIVYLEDMMAEAEGPLLAYGDIDRRPLFSPRMVHSGYELDEFPEDYIRRLVHDGYDTLLTYVRGAGESARGKTDFNVLIDLAASYGLDVYAYSYIISEKHPDDEGAEEYYESTYGRLFRESPGFRGVVFVGESCEFPSHDERVYPWLCRYHPKDMPIKKCFSRNFPVSDYPDWLNLVKRVIRKYSPEADILFWSYNWGGRPAAERVALIDNLPLDVSLQATFEMYEPLPAPEGVVERATDYTICYPGPGKYFISEAEAAKRRGLRLYTISNTAGMTWDVGVIPYVPAPFAWAERYDKLIECHDRYGLSGLMESHHYGAYPSIIAELSREMGWVPRRPFKEHLEAILIREFGKENLADALKAFEHASEGIRHDVPTVEDQYGPLRVGPAYPLVTETADPIPPDPESPRVASSHTFTAYGMKTAWLNPHCLEIPRRILFEMDEFSRMRDEYDAAAEIFRAIAERSEGRRRTEAGRLAALTYFMARTAETTVNVKRFSVLRRAVMEWRGIKPMILTATEEWHREVAAYYGVDAITEENVLALAEPIVRAECENAERVLPALAYDSRLGYEPSMEYTTDPYRIAWKIEYSKKAYEELCALVARR